MTPQSQIENCILVWSLAANVHCSAENGKLLKSHLFDNVSVETGDEGVSFSGPSSQANLVDVSYNLFLAAFGTCATGVDVALDQQHGGKERLANDVVNSVRNIIYLVRCCFAHGPLVPKWEVQGQLLREHRVTLTGRTIALSADRLNGQAFKPSDVGGLEGFCLLLKHALESCR